jgi:NADPH:quinone reductase-like Zn-dependent oxidoreductase
VLIDSSVLPEHALSVFPDHLSYEEAACFPIAALTAWSALTEANLRPGQTVLATGSGNVSLFTLQLAKRWGARVIVSTGDTETRGARLRELGADAVVDYRDPAWPAQAVAANAGQGVDLIVENGGVRTLGASLEALRQGGFIAMVGLLALDGEAVADVTLPLLLKNARLRGIVTGNRDAYDEMYRAVALHQLRPVIDSVYPRNDVKGAFARAFEQRPFGKVVIRLSDEAPTGAAA